MASNEMSEWIKFFTSAGVPAGAATTYAVTFIDNRIQKTMLLDITKEYLKEMGINVMGDIISILKYCKTYHAQYERDKPAVSAMPVSDDGKVEVKRQTTAGSRMLEHYMRKQGVMDGGDCKVKVSTGMAARLGAVPAVGAKKNAVAMPQSVEVVPMKKVRRVTPEQEGKYIINMPEGTTAKTKKILEDQKAQAVIQGKKTVFDRLGDESKQKTSPIKKMESPNSVFKRLGGKKKVRSLSEISDSVCEYEGVLRSPPNSTGKIFTRVARTKVVATSSPGVASRLGAKVLQTGTPGITSRLGAQVLQSGSPGVTSRLGAKVLQIGTSGVPSRLGAKVTTPKRIQPPVTSTSNTSKMDQMNLKMNIKDRLGQQKQEVSSTSQNVPRKSQAIASSIKKSVITLDKSGLKRSIGVKQGLGIKKGSGVVKRLGTQLKSAEQTVTIRIPNNKLGKSTAMLARLGAKATTGGSTVTRGSLRQTGMHVRLGTPAKIAASPSVKERLGLQKAEASSTTPSVTVMINQKKAGLKSAKLNAKRMKNLNLTRTVSNSAVKNVFSRLGSSE
ncbi:uncharacterized protein [Antedon mediterranea]|uniref:uncharacterized protein n=1 Tax=Antedon mediterranea TaxID=105859 RepID=UPI003AF8ED1A